MFVGAAIFWWGASDLLNLTDKIDQDYAAMTGKAVADNQSTKEAANGVEPSQAPPRIEGTDVNML